MWEEMTMPRTRSNILKSLLLGLLATVVFTLIAMLGLSVALVLMRFGDRTITTLNQLIKLAAIVLGVCFAVPRGSQRGFVTGLVISITYTVIGYALYVALGGAGFSIPSMLGELLVGGAIGAVTGAVRANLQPKRRGSHAKARA